MKTKGVKKQGRTEPEDGEGKKLPLKGRIEGGASEAGSTHSLGHFWQLRWSYAQLSLVRAGAAATAHVAVQHALRLGLGATLVQLAGVMVPKLGKHVPENWICRHCVLGASHRPHSRLKSSWTPVRWWPISTAGTGTMPGLSNGGRPYISDLYYG